MTRPDALPHELEAHLEARLRKGVRLIGGRLVKLAPTEKGVPDRLVILPGGRMHLVELKTNVGRLSAAQQLWHQRAAELGQEVIVLSGAMQIDNWVRRMAGYFDKPDRILPRRKKVAQATPAPVVS